MLMVEPQELDLVIRATYLEDCKSPWKLRAKCNHRAELKQIGLINARPIGRSSPDPDRAAILEGI